jgi:DNA-binding CsgD family transcriptional regulator
VEADPTRKLSLRQRQCLRLTFNLKSSKEIALELGIRPRTVDSYLATAVTVLEATDRRHAARIFAQWNPDPLPQQSPRETIRVADSSTFPSPFASQTEGDSERVSFFAEPNTPAGAFGFVTETTRSLSARTGRTLNDLTPIKRLLLILGATVLCAIAIATTVNLVDALARLAITTTL